MKKQYIQVHGEVTSFKVGDDIYYERDYFTYDGRAIWIKKIYDKDCDYGWCDDGCLVFNAGATKETIHEAFETGDFLKGDELEFLKFGYYHEYI